MTCKRDRIQENASEYIVINCPAYKTFYPDIGAEPFTACDAELPFKRCQNCTDCVIKQVIDKCKHVISHYSNLGILSTMAEQILQLFDIEVQNERQL